jgi:hypothetical protein
LKCLSSVERHSNTPGGETAAGGPEIGRGSRWYHTVPKRTPAVPAPHCLSPWHDPRDRRTKGRGKCQGGLPLGEDRPRQTGPGEPKLPPCLPRPTSPRGLHSQRLRVLGGGNRPQWRWGERKSCRQTPPDNASPGGCTKWSRIAPGLNTTCVSLPLPLPPPRAGSRYLALLGELVDANAVHDWDPPSVLATEGGGPLEPA